MSRRNVRKNLGVLATAIITGSGGLIGSECVRHLTEGGYDVIGLENDMPAYFFGPHASTARVTEKAFREFHRQPRPAAVYNLGGGRFSNCSMLEAIALCEEVAGQLLHWTLSEDARMGDHRWWISDVGAFQNDYSNWKLSYDVRDIVQETFDHNADRWAAAGKGEPAS